MHPGLRSAIRVACAVAPALVIAVAPAAATPPLEEPVLTLSGSDLSWTACEGADGYDILYGDLNALRQSGGNYGTSVLGCLGQTLDLSVSHPDTPAPGTAWFYLLRAVGSNEAGTYDDSGDPAQAVPRDAAITTSPYACFDPINPHPVISIQSDADFTAANGVQGGLGTDASPYVIAGWELVCATQAQTGILIQDTSKAFVVRNLRIAFCGDGARLQDVPVGRVERSHFDADVNGVVLEGGGGQRLEGNTASGLSGTGLEVHLATGALVKGNRLYGNHAGIRLDGAAQAAVHHNDLLHNSLQAAEQGGSGNSWDDGFPDGGNHWDDYAGVDHCGGAAQDQCAGGDGLGDTPYPIGAAADRYPRIALSQPLGDTSPPVVSIQNPPATSFWESAQIPVSVFGTDQGLGIALVELRDNGGPWQPASGPQPATGGGTWSGAVTAVQGTNLIEARARDFAGNESVLASRTVEAAPPTAVWATSLTTDQASYVEGETVTMHYRVRNVTTSTLVVNFNSQSLTHFVVTDSQGTVVRHPLSVEFWSSQSFAPAQTIDFVMSWDQRNDAGALVVPGTYHLDADTDSLQDVPAAEDDITLLAIIP